MMDFLIENLGTIAVATVLLLVLTMAVLKIRKDKKQGKGCCSCGCEGWASAGICHRADGASDKK